MLLAAACAVNGFAQGFYVRAGLGYNIPNAGQISDGVGTPYSGTVTNTNNTPPANNYVSYNIDKVSFSNGLQGTIGVGYMFTEHIGADLSFSGTLSAKEYSLTTTNVQIPNFGASNLTIINKANNPMMLTPSIVLQTGCTVNVYGRMGVAIPLRTTILQDVIITNVPGTGASTTYDFTYEYHNKFSLGLAAALGVSYKINDALRVWLEVSSLSLSVDTKQADLVAATRNGQAGNIQGSTPTVFSRNFTADQKDESHLPAYSLPFSSIGANAGITFAFGKSASQKHTKGHK